MVTKGTTDFNTVTLDAVYLAPTVIKSYEDGGTNMISYSSLDLLASLLGTCVNYLLHVSAVLTLMGEASILEYQRVSTISLSVGHLHCHGVPQDVNV